MSNFKSFAEADFDAYQAKKWASNVYNLERLQVKQKLESLGKTLSPKLSVPNSHPLSWEVSVEHPAIWNNRQVTGQHLYFLRSPEARNEIQSRVSRSRPINNLLADPSPYKEHIHLSLSLDDKGIVCGLTLFAEAYVDHKNFLKKLENGWERSKFHGIYADLPSTFFVETDHLTEKKTPVKDLDPSKLTSLLLEDKKSASVPSGIVLRIANFLEKTDPRLTSPEISDTLLEFFITLIPLYGFIEWRRDNDHMEVLKEIREHRKEQISKRLSPQSPVRVTSGLWSGKKGIVQEVDARGHVKVLIGKITVQLETSDVIALSEK